MHWEAFFQQGKVQDGVSEMRYTSVSTVSIHRGTYTKRSFHPSDCIATTFAFAESVKCSLDRYLTFATAERLACRQIEGRISSLYTPTHHLHRFGILPPDGRVYLSLVSSSRAARQYSEFFNSTLTVSNHSQQKLRPHDEVVELLALDSLSSCVHRPCTV